MRELHDLELGIEFPKHVVHDLADPPYRMLGGIKSSGRRVVNIASAAQVLRA
jgi:hypothetical protein